jgi:hypothetical protein
MKLLYIIFLFLSSIFLSCSFNSHSNTDQTAGKTDVITYLNQAVDTSFTFDNLKVGESPKNWSTNITGEGPSCRWTIQAENQNKSLVQVSNSTEDYRFNIIINDNLKYKDLEINLRFKGIKGKGDQGGGPVWRYQDENNYYVVRANPLEDNYRLYKVVNGNRKMLKSANLKINSGEWYDIRVIMKGKAIACYLNNQLLIETTDDTFVAAGKIGLWTKSDAVTAFDDIKIKHY